MATDNDDLKPSAWQQLRSKQKQNNNIPPRFDFNVDLESKTFSKFNNVALPSPPNCSAAKVVPKPNDSIADLKSWMDQIQLEAHATAKGKYSQSSSSSLRPHSPLSAVRCSISSPRTHIKQGDDDFSDNNRSKETTQKEKSDAEEARMLLRTWNAVDGYDIHNHSTRSQLKDNRSRQKKHPLSDCHIRNQNIELSKDRMIRSSSNHYLEEDDDVHQEIRRRNKVDSFEGLFEETEEEKERIARLMPSPHSPNHEHFSYSQFAASQHSSQPNHHHQHHHELKGRSQLTDNIPINRTKTTISNEISIYEKRAQRTKMKEKEAMFEISCDIYIRRQNRKKLGRCFMEWIRYIKTIIQKNKNLFKKAIQFNKLKIKLKFFILWKDRINKILNFKSQMIKKKTYKLYKKLSLKLFYIFKKELIKINQFQIKINLNFKNKCFIIWNQNIQIIKNERAKAFEKLKLKELEKKEKAIMKWYKMKLISKYFLFWFVYLEKQKKENATKLKHEKEKNKIKQFVNRVAQFDCNHHHHTDIVQKDEETINGLNHIRNLKQKEEDKKCHNFTSSNNQLIKDNYGSVESNNTCMNRRSSGAMFVSNGVHIAPLSSREPTSLPLKSRSEVKQQEDALEEILIIGHDSNLSVRNSESFSHGKKKGGIPMSMEQRAEERRRARARLKQQSQTASSSSSSSSSSSRVAKSTFGREVTPQRAQLVAHQTKEENRKKASVTIQENRAERSARGGGGGRQSKEAGERASRVSTKDEMIDITNELSQMHYQRSLLLYNGIIPWKQLIKILKFKILKAQHFYHDKLLFKIWQYWLKYLKIRKKEKLRYKGEGIVWTLKFLLRKFLLRYLNHWLKTLKDCNAMSLAIHNQHSYYLLKLNHQKWKIAFNHKKKYFNEKIKELNKIINKNKKKSIIRLWYDLYLRKITENAVERRRAQRWKQVRGWLSEENA